MVTTRVEGGLVQPNCVCVAEYVPFANVETEAMLGLVAAALKPLGPVHAKLPAPVPVNKRVCRAQMGELLVMVGEGGMGLTVILKTAAVLLHPEMVCVTE